MACPWKKPFNMAALTSQLRESLLPLSQEISHGCFCDKSFKPDVPRPSYQVHRIEIEFGKQSRSSAVGRRPGLALASSSSSSGSGLNTLGNTLAEELINDQAGSSAATTGLSNAPVTDPMAGSVAGSETSLPHTPPSVTKPPVVNAGKAVVLSNVRRALQYEDSSTHGASQNVLEMAPQVDHEEARLLPVRDADTMLACRSVANADSEKVVLFPNENTTPASQSIPDVVSKELLPIADDTAVPLDPTVMPTPEKTAGSKCI